MLPGIGQSLAGLGQFSFFSDRVCTASFFLPATWQASRIQVDIPILGRIYACSRNQIPIITIKKSISFHMVHPFRLSRAEQRDGNMKNTRFQLH